MSSPRARLYAVDLVALQAAFADREATMFDLIEHLEAQAQAHCLDSNDQPDYLDMVAMDDLFAAMGLSELSYSSLLDRALPGIDLRSTDDGLLAVGHLAVRDVPRILAAAAKVEVAPAASADQRAAIENLLDALRITAQLQKDLVLVCP